MDRCCVVRLRFAVRWNRGYLRCVFRYLKYLHFASPVYLFWLPAVPQGLLVFSSGALGQSEKLHSVIMPYAPQNCCPFWWSSLTLWAFHEFANQTFEVVPRVFIYLFLTLDLLKLLLIVNKHFLDDVVILSLFYGCVSALNRMLHPLFSMCTRSEQLTDL